MSIRRNLLLTVLLLVLQVLASFAFAEDTPSSAKLLFRREDSRRARAQLIKNETKEIRLATYHFLLDDVGEETLGLLVDARRRGVKVKLILDGMPVGLPKERALLRALRELGVEIKIYNPLFRNPHRATYRTHMKSLIGTESFIAGDRNVAETYFARRTPDKHISIDTEINDQAALKSATEHFDEFFASDMVADPIGPVSHQQIAEARESLQRWSTEAVARRRPLGEIRNYPVRNVRYVADMADPATHATGISQDILQMIRRSQSSLTLFNPYVALTPELRQELESALKRGVKIKLISNSSNVNNARVMGLDWQVTAPELVKMGIEVQEVEAEAMLHAKTMVRDNLEVYIGSYNFDPRSQNLNVENGVFFESEGVARQLNTYSVRIRPFLKDVVLPDPKTLTPAERAARCFRINLIKVLIKPVRPHI